MFKHNPKNIKYFMDKLCKTAAIKETLCSEYRDSGSYRDRLLSSSGSHRDRERSRGLERDFRSDTITGMRHGLLLSATSVLYHTLYAPIPCIECGKRRHMGRNLNDAQSARPQSPASRKTGTIGLKG